MYKLFLKYFLLIITILIVNNVVLFSNNISDSTFVDADSITFLYSDEVSFINNNDSIIDSLAFDITAIDTLEYKSENELESPVDYSSDDSIKFFVKERKIYMYGKGDVKYEDIHLQSNIIRLDMDNREIFAKGVADSNNVVAERPIFVQGADEFDSDSLRYNFKSKKGLVYGIFTEQPEGFLHSNKTKITEERHINIQDGKFTTCDHPHPHYYIAMTKAKVIPDDQIVTGPAYLVIEDIPVPLAIPFGFFPISKKRSGGILMPTYGDDARLGYFLKNGGIYFGLSDYIDFKLIGDVYSLGTYRSRIESNYVNRYKYSGNFALEYASMVEDEERLPYSFSIQWSHAKDRNSNPNTSFSSSVNFQTMGHDKRNAKTQNDYLTNDLSSSISYRIKLGSLFSNSFSIRHSQSNRDSSITVVLPEYTLSMNSITPFSDYTDLGLIKNIRVGYGFVAQNKVTTKYDSTFFSNNTLNKFLYAGQHTPSISSSAQFLKYFTVTPSINSKVRWYFNEIIQDVKKDSIIVDDILVKKDSLVIDTVPGFYPVYDYNFNIGLSTKVYGMYNFRSKYFKAIRHILTPSVSYTYTPDFSKEKWGYYDTYETSIDTIKYSKYRGMMYGSPPEGESQVVSFSISNNLELKVANPKDTVTGTKKIKLIENLSLSASYNFAADSLNWSTVNLSGRTTLFSRLSVNYNATFDPYAASWDENKNMQARKNEYIYTNYGPRLLRMTQDVWSVSPTLRLGPLKDNDRLSKEYKGYYTYNVPWSLNLSYSFNRTRKMLYDNNQNIISKDPTINQTLRFDGNFKLTSNISTSFSSGWDLEAGELTNTSISVIRDLHCWEMSFRWIPMGVMKSIEFTIRVKANVLKDLKIDKSERYGEIF